MMFESTLQKFTILGAVIWRIGIVIAVVSLNSIGGFSKPETWRLISMILPVSCLYLTTSINFVRHSDGFIRENKSNRANIFWVAFISLIYLLQLLGLALKAFWGLTANTLYNLILITECICAIYGTLFLSGILGIQGNNAVEK